ncbi:TetR/AcrR family transcriptional regulator [Sphingobacterium lactis]|uniref:TetR/AcrR family transcriptional regulator n=1 Tax=Sphingobacterium TaxID=28453 RepID=UPI0021A7EAA0|nr:TetR/AcrR family transcriptional regulator [Sphingobacterium hotanense]MCT1525807.1 TetR/AcrR family transcriptional regulator [Sphingobacterium hotanense]
MGYRNRKNGVYKKNLKDRSKKTKQTRNKQATIKLFREAAERLLSEGGLKALKINSLQKEAGKSKSLIYDYFGGIAGVLRDVLETTDIWLSYHGEIKSIISKHYEDNGQSLAIMLLQEYFARFSKDKLAQEISLLELSKKRDRRLRELSESREHLGNELFNISQKYFSGDVVSIRMVSALLLGGINYLVLHANCNDSTFCGIDIKTDKDKDLMNKTLEQIVAWAYEHAA